MDLLAFLLDPVVFSAFVLPVLIFLARVLDVSLGTIRIIFVSREMKYLAPVVGFFEVLIWLLAITKIMQNINNVVNYLAYAGGFATGNFVGIMIEQKLAMGHMSVVVVTKKDPTMLINELEESKYRTTTIDAKGEKSAVEMVFIISPRKRLQKAVNIVKKFDPNAFYSIEDIKDLQHVHLSLRKRHLNTHLLSFRKKRKEK